MNEFEFQRAVCRGGRSISEDRRASGWGSMHSQPPCPANEPKISEAGGMLHKSRVGKGSSSLVCQECVAEGAVQLECLHVLCRTCAKEHVCE